jgi:hypothetical protein
MTADSLPRSARDCGALIRVLTACAAQIRSMFIDKVISERWSSRTGSDLRRGAPGG